MTKKNTKEYQDSEKEHESDDGEMILKGNMELDEEQCESVLKTNPFDKRARLRLS